MTRRRILFSDKNTGKTYITCEFNGDKEDFWNCRAGDTCNMYWEEIINTYFSNIKTLDEFKTASENAQKEYISNITGESEILPIEEITDIKYYKSIYGNNLYCI